MGLDMYLFKKQKNNKDSKAEELMYWRKANQIRQWIVTHTEYQDDYNCVDFDVTKEILEELLKDCKRVLLNRNLAPQIMPTSRGFFFGSDEYDEYYFDELKKTAEKLERIINEVDWENERVYYSEWW